MIKVLYTSALLDSSGYAEAARNNVLALMTQPEIDLYLRSVSFETWKTDLSSFSKKVEAIAKKKCESPDVEIIHLTPENFERLTKVGKKTIGLTTWETDLLPGNWVRLCNTLDEIWVPCDWNVEVFKNSGVTVPVKKVPHCVDLEEFKNFKKNESLEQQIKANDAFVFYSIFQWNARKNPEGLIKAYLSEFNANEKVSLVLKTYKLNNTPADKESVISSIKQIKKEMQLEEKTPPIILLHGGMSRDEMLTIHNSGDCFVLPHRAEGWGVPHFEALAMGRPVISTGFSGNLEFMTYYNSWLLNFHSTPVSGMNRPNYHGKMHWAEPHLDSLQKCMREAYSNRALCFKKGAAAIDKVSQFTLEKVGQTMKDYLIC